MNSELRPCPACGGEKFEIQNFGWFHTPHHSVVCLSCYMRGPWEQVENGFKKANEGAVNKWNALPRREDAQELVDALGRAEIALGIIDSKKPGGTYYQKYADAVNTGLMKARVALENWKKRK